MYLGMEPPINDCMAAKYAALHVVRRSAWRSLDTAPARRAGAGPRPQVTVGAGVQWPLRLAHVRERADLDATPVLEPGTSLRQCHGRLEALRVDQRVAAEPRVLAVPQSLPVGDRVAAIHQPRTHALQPGPPGCDPLGRRRSAVLW